jgi:hypothetical protein
MTPTQMQNPSNYKNSKGGEELQKQTRSQRNYMDHNK